tara:strand:+ start:909 stop:1175 length:267 start_codon:yes stop_codon:yes gene_type:complete
MAVKQLSIFDSIKKNNKMAKKKAVKSAGLKAGGKLKKGFKFAKGGKVIKVSATKSKSKSKSKASSGSPITYAGKVGKGRYRYVYDKKS